MNWRSYNLTDISDHTVVIGRKTIKEAKNTIRDTYALNSRSYEFSDISAHTVLKSLKRVNLLFHCTELAEL